MIFGTVSSAGHLPRAMIMAKSIKDHMPGSRVVVGIIEETMPSAALHFPYFDEIILVKNICMYPNYRKFFFQYRVQEAAGSSKAQIMKYIYDKYTDEQLIVYMDSDMKVMAPFDELHAIADRHPIIITGHITNPDLFDAERLPIYRIHGIYNSGFLAFKRHPVAEKYLLWWAKLCERYGFIDHEQKIYTDQTWLDLAHNYFDDVYSLRHPGYNVGPWNMGERWNIDQVGPSTYTIDGSPLKCVHFSFNFLLAASWIDANKGRFYNDIFHEYSRELEAMGQSTIGKTPWSYGFYTSGELISDQARVAYRKNYYDNPEISNPFLLSNAFFVRERASDGAAASPALPASQRARRLRRKLGRRKSLSKASSRSSKRGLRRKGIHKASAFKRTTVNRTTVNRTRSGIRSKKRSAKRFSRT